MPIKILEPAVAAKIAAGEVVERPASVVKELVENSLDASATQVTVEIRGGGLSLIRVMDNGAGIPPDEVDLAFNRYATSKISQFEDLASATTLGFRGEALPSIAAVAQVDLVTCTRDDTSASQISLKDGVVIGRGTQGRSPGTTVTVKNLFRSVPARLKFLKSPATENSHIANVVSQYALAYPEVRFVLLMEGRVVLRTPGGGRLIDSVSEIYGAEMARHLLEIRDGEKEWQGGEAGAVQVSGLVSPPELSRASRDYISFFVNRRWVSSRLLSWAAEEAYHGLLMTGRHPVTIINITLPAGEVDANIHPTKAEVKFRNEPAVFGAIQRAIRRTLLAQAPVPRIEEPPIKYASPQAVVSFTEPLAEKNIPARQMPVMPTPAASLPVLRVLGQLAGCYILAEGPEGLYLIDQHAAHERILFEQVMAKLGEIEVQGLLAPVTLEITARQEQSLASGREKLARFGFNIEPFGNRTCLIRAVPALLHDKDWRQVLSELLDMPASERWAENIAKSIACHSAVRAGQTLSDNEIREFIRQLESVSVPHTCPHGRPTMINIRLGYIRGQFGRE